MPGTRVSPMAKILNVKIHRRQTPEPPMSIRNPHDAFFRQVFGQPEVAADFLANYLPANVRAHLDLSQVELQQDSFLDPVAARALRRPALPRAPAC